MPVPAIGAAHRRRLRALWRSAGWPCQDVIEAELIVAGLVERRDDGQGRTTLRVTDAGVAELAREGARQREVRSAHEGLVSRVATTLARDGRLAWCGLSLRAAVPVGAAPFANLPTVAMWDVDPPAPAVAGQAAEAPATRWQLAMPDVYSVRLTSVATCLQPLVHEIKVSRADLLADLRQPVKRSAYLQMAGAVFYVLAEGVGDADDVPPECGVLRARGPRAEHAARGDEPVELEMLRNAPQRALDAPAGLPFAVWMALARRAPLAQPDDGQMGL